MSCEYVRQCYGVPAEIGRRIVAYGDPGVIAEDRGNYIGVTLDSEKPGVIHNYHPTDGIVYEGMGVVRRMTRAQERYARYRRVSECFESFLEFLRWDAAQKGGAS